MSEWGRAGGRLPHDPEVQGEHQREMREAIEHEGLREPERRPSAPPKRPWWKFWSMRSR